MPRSRSSRRPTCSCGALSTGSSTWTMRRRTSCRNARRSARSSPGRWVSIPGRRSAPRSIGTAPVCPRNSSRCFRSRRFRSTRSRPCGPGRSRGAWRSSAFATPPGLRRQLIARQGDEERQMDWLREAHHAQVFRLLAQDLSGLLGVERLADDLSDLADVMLQVTLELCWTQLRARHRDGPCFAIIGYGKLGGKELGYASDLDLIFLYDDSDDRAPEIYARLARRLNLWLTSRTPAGVLYDIDLRLRPEGESGLLVSSIDAFRRYQRESAWTWEHQALTRARFCAGEATGGAEFEEERRSILQIERDEANLREDVLSMREQLLRGHPNDSGLFDLKHDRGGMIDIQFIVQLLVLAHAPGRPGLTANDGNIALLKLAAKLGLIPADSADAVADAYREFRRRQHRLRLNGAKYARVPAAEVQNHIDATRALWREVFGKE